MREQLGYEPRDLALFRAALTHRSAAGANNERLEFLGDAVLNLLIARASVPSPSRRRRGGPEPPARAAGQRRAAGARSPPQLGLGDVLQLGSGELKTGGFRRQSILADALEALCGAVFLDGGLDAARSR